MEAYCQRQGLQRVAVRFIYDGFVRPNFFNTLPRHFLNE